ncbi:D-alanyl-D-alanine carboxypeptidase family protein [Enterococcus mundtii]|uniref:D-alanyl-D-alanine carboxypeptidase family protein n=1 Tax=Enterococcus mundtii TaxID=53346 RepID=UPI000ACBCDDB|nr:serine hydrolase [Enterococcus mundtii]
MKKIILASILCILVGLLYCSYLGKDASKETNKITVPLTAGKRKEYKKIDIQLDSEEYILSDLKTNQILLEKNKDARVPIASLTKLMTTFILLDKKTELSEKVSVDPAVVQKLRLENASLAGFIEGDLVTVEDLAYGMILPSGGEAAVLAAKLVAGDENTFAKQMNDYAKRLGMKNTKFVNCTGLDQKENYSTVYDILKFLTNALKNKVFYKVFTTLEYNTQPTLYSPKGYVLTSSLLRENQSLSLNKGKILGGKTGYTPKAGLCLASIAEINGNKYIQVSTHASGESALSSSHIKDAVKVYNYLFQSL